MRVVESSMPAVLCERASLQPNDTAFTFIDYEQDWAGVAESLTWSQVYRRAKNVAHELRRCASSGDRALILAPQGLDYITAFLGTLQAGLIAVPLSAPMGGPHDERVHSVLHDTSPSVILATSSVVSDVAKYVQSQNGESGPSVIEVDSLDLDSRQGSNAGAADSPSTAYLQYTSGSTRRPAGVMISHTNLLANIRQIASDYFSGVRKGCPAGHHHCVVAAALSRSGFDLRNLRTDSGRSPRCVHESSGVPTTSSPMDAIAGQQ